MAALAVRPKIPVTVLTGFLGAGKTTLLNRILTSQHGLQLAVIENEFGEVGVDDSLVRHKLGSGGEEIFEMNNGCICCTVRGDLIRIITKLLNREKRLDGIIIETTGLADPAPVAQTFFMDPAISGLARLDAIVTVVDAEHVVQHLDEVKPEGAENEAEEQIAFADVILLNKTDRAAGPAALDAVEARLRAINKVCKVVRCKDCEVDIKALVLGVRAFSLDRVLAMDPAFLGEDQEHVHDERVTSVGFREGGDLDIGRLNQWFATLLREHGRDLFRMKGVLAVAGSECKFVFQGVHMNFRGEPMTPWAQGEARVSKLVFIGKHLDKMGLRDGFNACKATVSP